MGYIEKLPADAGVNFRIDDGIGDCSGGGFVGQLLQQLVGVCGKVLVPAVGYQAGYTWGGVCCGRGRVLEEVVQAGKQVAVELVYFVEEVWG